MSSIKDLKINVVQGFGSPGLCDKFFPTFFSIFQFSSFRTVLRTDSFGAIALANVIDHSAIAVIYKLFAQITDRFILYGFSTGSLFTFAMLHIW